MENYKDEQRRYFMAGFGRKVTWEEYSNNATDRYVRRNYFMAGYSRVNNWEQHEKRITHIAH